MRQRLFLPKLLESRAEKLLRLEEVDESLLFRSFDDSLQDLEDTFSRYRLDFPVFIKVDAWKSPEGVQEDSEVWILERLGWGYWKKRGRLLYVMEAVSIPQIEDAEVLSVNSSSPPFLEAAEALDWAQEIQAEQVQAIPLYEAPELIKEKSYPFVPEFLFLLSDTLQQMQDHQSEFQEFVEEKVEEFVRERSPQADRRRRHAVQHYFRTERRVELFMEFLTQKHHSSGD